MGKDSDKREVPFIVKRAWRKIFILPKIARSRINAKIDKNAEIVPGMLFFKTKSLKLQMLANIDKLLIDSLQ